ncbi:MAG TPA: P27 family phage terminase small subunit [Devosia sp.]|nr:P27 family phage terminase small subunit [Devosia sp.]
MAGGRPRKPTHLKVVGGTLRKHRENPDEPEVAGGWPDAPAWLSARSAVIFEETCNRMSGMGTLSTEWADVIADYASCVEEIELTTAIVEDVGRTYTTTTATGDTMFRPRPEVSMRSDAMKRAQALRAELGLGPASKSKVGGGKKSGANPFGQIG